MRNEPSGGTPDLGGLIGEDRDEVAARLGPPSAERATGEDRWMVFEGAGWSLRVRLAPVSFGEGERVRSWTVSLDPGFPDLLAACDALSLAPARPTAADAGTGPALLRRKLPDPRTGDAHSLTARASAGTVDSLTAFDEPPEWRSPGGER